MPIFVIAGKADCPHFVHAIQVATYLSEQMPNVTLNKHEFHGEEWNQFLLDINSAHNWFITSSPVIWKEVGFAGSKPHLIGGLSEFWEYIDDYYGTKPFFDSDSLKEITARNFNAYKEKIQIAKENSRTSVVGVYGFNNNLAYKLIPELFDIPDLFVESLATIKLYDKEALHDVDREDEIRSLIESFEAEIQAHVRFDLILCTNLSMLIENTDFLLITENYAQRDDEDRQTWYERCSTDMQELSEEINDRGTDNLRIICCHPGPVCFTATSIIKHTRENYRKHVVAVTAHEGLKALNLISKLTDIPVSNLAAPPVWGFVGMDEFIDVQAIIVLQDIITPYRRAIKDIRDSTLPQKKVRKELRLLSCIINKKDFENSMIKRCNMYSNLGRTPFLPLLRATLHLIELWCSRKKSEDTVISLGIYSDGSSGIPLDIIFSRPVCLVDNFWVPFEKLPILQQSREDLKKCKLFTFDLIEMIRGYI